MVRWFYKFFLFVIKIIGVSFEMLLSFLAISLVLSLVQFTPTQEKTTKNTLIYLRSNGVHLDLILPVKTKFIQWDEKIPFSDTPANDTSSRYIAFGWGEANFFLQTPHWSDFKITNMAKSLFFMGKSAMHITYIKKIRKKENIVALYLSDVEYQNLATFIQKELKQNSDGSLQLIQQNKYGKNDAFYYTKSPYNLFYTCNSWINDALKSANQKHCLWTPFSYVLFQFYRK